MSVSEINIQVFRAINDLGKDFSFINPIFLFFAEYSIYLLALSLLFYWFTRKKENRVMVISAFTTFILAEMLGKIAGKLHQNNQPFAELIQVNQLVEKAIDNSFPSDHTILFFSICTVFWLFKKKYRLGWLLLAICVGTSRIGVGVHYPADVLVGAIISIVSAFIIYKYIPNLNITLNALRIYEKIETSVVPKVKK